MAAMSRGRVVKTRPSKQTKGGTPSTRRHHFESFSQRVAKLKIEPIRRGRTAIIDDSELAPDFSYFREAFLEWRELNLSEAFSSFARQVAPLCDSLAQVLHHGEPILDRLVEYIEKEDQHSEEPLLSLLAHLAHDLGAAFEDYFEKAVRTVSRLAARHPDVEVIEWSFTCLAWLFKYLSRLLVTDLRPVFDLMAPLLGRQHQKPFVTTFAADSLSFLVRKAGALYRRDRAPLRRFIQHVADQLQVVQDSGKVCNFPMGIMSLFTEAMRGVQRGIHSVAVPILKELLYVVFDGDHNQGLPPPMQPLLLGIITAIIHHTDAQSFRPLAEMMIIEMSQRSSHTSHFQSFCRVIYTFCGVRRGSRILDWESIWGFLDTMLDAHSENGVGPSYAKELLSALAVVAQYCPLDVAIANVRTIERVTQPMWEKHFLPFCNMFSGLGKDRFQSLLLPYFKKFFSQKAHEHGTNLYLALIMLYTSGPTLANCLQPSDDWQNAVVQSFQKLSHHVQEQQTETIAYECNAALDALAPLTLSSATQQALLMCMQESLHYTLNLTSAAESTLCHRPVDHLAMGKGLQYIATAEQPENLDALWPPLCSAAAAFAQLPAYWKGLSTIAERRKGNLVMAHCNVEALEEGILGCLGAPSHEMRYTSLSLLRSLADLDESRLRVLDIAILIEETPPSFENQRSLSMRIAQLAKLYSSVTSDKLIGAVIPMFLFGLLHIKLASVWADVCSALQVVCETKEGETHVSQIALTWITNAPTEPASEEIDPGATPTHYAGQFECTNIMALDRISSSAMAPATHVNEQLRKRFENDHVAISLLSSFSRAQALRVLTELPSIAEKRARVLVPVLIEWSQEALGHEPMLEVEVDAITVGGENDVRSNVSKMHSWSRKDQKALLAIFAKFNNPCVLYRATEVYEALLSLLGNGDSEIQKSALNAILTWKDAAIGPYQENLRNLLDDARFRDEISVFLDTDSTSSSIRGDHRESLFPVLLRILYGRVINGKRDLGSKRKAVFQALTRFGDDILDQFLLIALGRLSSFGADAHSILPSDNEEPIPMEPRRQVGLVNMLGDMVDVLKTNFSPHLTTVIGPLVCCLVAAHRILTKASLLADSGNNGVVESRLSLYKAIRQRSLHIMSVLFETCPMFAWNPYANVVVRELFQPRIVSFPKENAHSVSGLLRIFAAWSGSIFTACHLSEHHPLIIPSILGCLAVPSAKDNVKQYILNNIIRALVKLTIHNDHDTTEEMILKNKVLDDVMRPHCGLIIECIGKLLHQSPSKDVLECSVSTIADCAPYVGGSVDMCSIVEIACFLVRQPSKRVSAPVKRNLLGIVHEFVPRCGEQDVARIYRPLLDAISPLLSYVQDGEARTTICSIIQELSAQSEELSGVAGLCLDLNAFSASRLDELDFKRRSRAYDAITRADSQTYSLFQWKLLVYNAFFDIKNASELSIRLNASLALRRFLRVTVADLEVRSFLSAAVLPGIQYGIREPSELVRIEILGVLSQLVESHHEWAPIADLSCLLSAEDEASIFNNILHIQGHRRLRALRRLASLTASLQSGNISYILLPLLEHFIFDKADHEIANTLAGEAIRTVSALCEGLEWSQFRSLLRRYTSYLTSKEDQQRSVIKLLGALLGSLKQVSVPTPAEHSALDQAAMSPAATQIDDEILDNGNESSTRRISGDKMMADRVKSTLAHTLPSQGKLGKDLITNILPDLTTFLHKKDESTVSLRVPVAIAVTKALLLLPPAEIEIRLPAVLLDVCHILRSRAQDSRDMARTTLVEIASFTGPSYLGFILKALRLALQRGYQLHVLSFVLHSILVHLAESMEPGDLDYCLSDVVDVIMDDTFGLTGQEKDAEGYISSMKEIRSNKSYDSMTIISRFTTPSYLAKLLQPINFLLADKINPKAVQKIDEMLRRIGLGILENSSVGQRDILVFCYEVIQQVYASKKSSASAQEVDFRHRKYLINVKGAARSGNRTSANSYQHKITKFGLDVLRTVLRKHADLLTSQNMAGFLPILGDAMLAQQEEVQVSATRLLTTIIKLPMQEFDDRCTVYVEEAISAIKGAPSSNTELAQASLKFITAVLKDRPSIEVKERHVAQLLKRILPDLDQPDRQGVTFGFVKAVLNRKIVITEIYAAMDKVAEMMITNHARTARDLARSNYFHFIMEFPQTKTRFQKQLQFLLRNLRYDYVEGRQSAMEAINLVLDKIGDDVLQEELAVMLIPLVHSLANDESGDCRAMAGALVKKTFSRADDQRSKTFKADLKTWLEQDEDPGLKRLAIQCWGFFFEATTLKSKELAFVNDKLEAIVTTCVRNRDIDDWELIYYSLVVFSKIIRAYPETMVAANKSQFWSVVQQCVAYPHAWVKVTAAKLMGSFFADFASNNGDANLDSLPLQGSGSLLLTEMDMIRLTDASLRNLTMPNLGDDLCTQCVRNLAFLARCLAANGAIWRWTKEEDDAMEDEDANFDEPLKETASGADESEEEWGGFSSPAAPVQVPGQGTPAPAIQRLLLRLSAILRRETKIVTLAALAPKTAVLNLLHTLIAKLPLSSFQASPALHHLLTTLSTLSDPLTTHPRSVDPAFNTAYTALIDKSSECMTDLQKRLGSADFVKMMAEVGKGVRERREERRGKRRADAVNEPEKAGREKKRKNEHKREKRKEKNLEYRGKRRGW